MRRLLSAPAVMIVSASLLAQTSPPAAKSGVPPPTCMVAGRVVTAADGSPLKSARVFLLLERSDSNKRQMFAATTDSDGHFLLKDVPPGRYRFVATRPGFVNQPYQAKGSDDGALLSLKPGDKVGDVLFRMIVSGVITGRVTNDDGEGVVHAQVMALRAPSEDEIEDRARCILAFFREVGTTRGFFGADRRSRPVSHFRTQARRLLHQERRIHMNPTGIRRRMRAIGCSEFQGSEYASVYYPGVAQSSQAQVVSVKAGDEVQADVFMQRIKTAEIAGHVIGRNGPTKSAWVEFSAARDRRFWHSSPGYDRRERRLQIEGRTAG